MPLSEALERLFPEKKSKYQTKVIYSNRFSQYNANIKLHKNILTLHCHNNWKTIDKEITIGLAQWLLTKLFKKKTSTFNIELYNNFIKQIPTITPKTKSNPILYDSFLRVNEKFFENNLLIPNLQWGKPATRRLASYDFHTDTVTVSSIFINAPIKLLDYLMYHELLHKHFQFKCKNGRQFFHTSEFRHAEQKYPNYKQIEKELNKYILPKKHKKKSLLDYFSQNSRDHHQSID